MDTIGTRIKQLRKHLGLSQKDFCQKVSIPQSRLSEIESDKTKPSYPFLQNASDIFNVSLDWLIVGKGQMFHITEAPTINNATSQLQPDEIVLVSKYHELTERQKGRVDQQIDIYLAENKKSSPSTIGDKEEFTSNLA